MWCPQRWGFVVGEGFLGAMWTGCISTPRWDGVAVFGCQGSDPIVGMFGFAGCSHATGLRHGAGIPVPAVACWVGSGGPQGPAARARGCSGSICLSIPISSLSLTGSAVGYCLVQRDAAQSRMLWDWPHPPAYLGLKIIFEFPHSSLLEQIGLPDFLVPCTGKGIDRKNLSLFHLNIKLKSKRYKVHFLMCCPIPVGLLSLFFFKGTVIKSSDKARTVLCRSQYLRYLSPFFTL